MRNPDQRRQRSEWAGVICGLVLVSMPSAGAVNSVTDGDWNNPSTWDTGIPGSGETVNINDNVTVGASTATVGTVTINGSLTFQGWSTTLNAADVIVNGTVTHDVNTDTAAPWVGDNRVLISAANVTVTAAGTINANHKGYTGGVLSDGRGPGGGKGASSSGGGGGHGGKGGYIPGRGPGGDVYGIAAMPDEPGSGGGGKTNNASRIGGNGGGAVRIVATATVTVDGMISADGQVNSGGNDAGGGSGGSIWVTCQDFQGSGWLVANGGDSTYGGGGGGGIIAVDYAGTAAWSGKVQTDGGVFSGAVDGETGILYIPDTQLLTTTLDGQFFVLTGVTAWSPASLSLNASEVLLDAPGFTLTVGGNLALSASQLVLYENAAVSAGGNISVGAGSEVLLYSNTTTGASPSFSCTDFTVAAGAIIDADGKGYLGGSLVNGDGPGGGIASSSSGGGGGHGGVGGYIPGRGPGGPTYDSISAPSQPGSGGGGKTNNAGRIGGAGGGMVQVNASGTATVDGTISANGAANTGGNDAGGGSGGTIRLTCAALAGSGVLRANGGNASWGGPGGGGRIAVDCGSATWAGTVQVAGGTFSQAVSGQVGTFYCPIIDVLPEAMVDQYFRFFGPTAWSPTALSMTDSDVGFEDPGFLLAIAGSATLSNSSLSLGILNASDSGDLSVGDDLTLNGSALTVHSDTVTTVGGTMTVGANATVSIYSHDTTGVSPFFDVGSLLVAVDGTIEADAKGYAGGVAADGLGPGGGKAASTTAGGGGYGGHGGRFAGRGLGGTTYPDEQNPTEPGSGGGGKTTQASWVGGAGGGLVRVEAETAITVDGLITAGGGFGNQDRGAGSGGGINLRAPTFAGTGAIEARGGDSVCYAAVGGGGRIAVWRQTDTFSGSTAVDFGVSSCPANQIDMEVGTVFFGILNNPPTAACQNLTVALTASGSVTILPAAVDGGSSDPDAGDTLTLTLDQDTFTCADVGANAVVLTVTDSGGLEDTCPATVTVTSAGTCDDLQTAVLDDLCSTTGMLSSRAQILDRIDAAVADFTQGGAVCDPDLATCLAQLLALLDLD